MRNLNQHVSRACREGICVREAGGNPLRETGDGKEICGT